MTWVSHTRVIFATLNGSKVARSTSSASRRKCQGHQNRVWVEPGLVATKKQCTLQNAKLNLPVPDVTTTPKQHT